MLVSNKEFAHQNEQLTLYLGHLKSVTQVRFFCVTDSVEEVKTYTKLCDNRSTFVVIELNLYFMCSNLRFM